MFRPRWVVTLHHHYDPRAYGIGSVPEIIDGPFRLKWIAEAAASSHRAHEAQRARYDHDAIRHIEVQERVYADRPGIGLP